MQQVKVFQQKNVIAQVKAQLPTKGVCFRLTFKWAACTLVGGTFNYNPNADKVATKHSAYRTGTLAEEKRLGGDFKDLNDFLGYTTIDWKAARAYATQWGSKFTDSAKTVFTNVYVDDQSTASVREYLQTRPSVGSVAILAGFYGRAQDGKSAWGHVVAYCAHGAPNGGGPCFFDSNYGLYAFGPNEDAGAAMMTHIKGYTQNGRRIEAYNTLVLKAR